MEIQPVITLKPLGSSCGSLGCLEARTGLSWKLLGPTCLFNKKRILKTLSSLLGQIPLGHPLTHSLCCPNVKQQKAHPRTRGTPTRKSAGGTGPLPRPPPQDYLNTIQLLQTMWQTRGNPACHQSLSLGAFLWLSWVS